MDYDVIIIGGGPAGATAAFTLATQGCTALLLEKAKLPRYKVCGGGLVYRGRCHLPFDISPVVEREFFQIDWKLDEGLDFTVARLNTFVGKYLIHDR